MTTMDNFTTKLNNLDNYLSNKLDPIKGLIKEYDTDPVKQYSMSDHDRQTIATLKKYAPSLFKDTVPYTSSNSKGIGLLPTAAEQPDTLATAQTNLANKAYQSELAGLAPKDTYTKAVEGGYIPDTRNKNIWGILEAQTQYPLKKLMSALTAIPRGMEANIAQEVKNTVADKKITSSDIAKMAIPAWFKPTFYKAVANRPGEYQDYTGAKMYKDIADTFGIDKTKNKFFKQYEFTKDQNDWHRGLNWIQKLASGIAGSPADIAGLATDIALDPLTYISGGLGKGASVATTLEKDLGEAGLKAGAKLALKPAGKKIVSEFIEKGGDELIQKFAKETAEMSADQAARFIERKVSEEAIRSALKSGVSAEKIIDYGGMKMFGQTVIKGADFEKFAPLKPILNPTKLNEIPVLRNLNKWFNPFAGVPDEFRPLKAYVDSKAQARMAQELKNIQPIVKNLTKEEQDTIAKYSWLMGDIERIQGRGNKVTQALEELTGKTSAIKQPNILKYINDLKKQSANFNFSKLDIDAQINELKEARALLIDEIKDRFGKIPLTPSVERSEWNKLPLELKGKLPKDPFEKARAIKNMVGLDEIKFSKDENYTYLKDTILNKYSDAIQRDWQGFLTNTNSKNIKKYAENLLGNSGELQDYFDSTFLNKSDDEILQELVGEDITRQTEKANEMGITFDKPDPQSIAGLYYKNEDLAKQKLKDFYKSINKNKGILNYSSNKIAELQAEIDKLNITPKIKEAYTKLRNWLDDLYIKDIKNIDVANLEKYYPHRYQGQTPTIIKSSELGRKVPRFSQLQNADLLEVQKQGLKPKSFINTLTERAWESTQREFRTNLTNEAKQFGRLTKNIPEGWVKIGDKIPELKNWALPKEYADTLGRTYNQFFGDEATKNILKVYDKMQTIWKRWALATPGYHFRNFFSDNFSGLMQYGLDWVNPINWKKGWDILRGRDVELTDKLGKKFIDNIGTFTESGILGPTQHATEGLISKEGKILNYISPAQWSMKFGNKRENLGRAVAGVIERENGNNLVNAAFNVKKVFFDYTNLTANEKNIMKRIIPFYTWLRKNLERQFELLGKRTGAYAAVPKVMNYIENVADTNIGNTQEYQNYKPDYFKDLEVIRTGMKDNNGNAIAINPNLPFQDWSRLGWKDLLSSLSPMIKIPIETGLNKDVFFGTDIVSGKNYQEAPSYMRFLKFLPEKVLSAIGAKKDDTGKVYISDRTAYAIRQVPMLYSLSRMFPATEQVNTPSQWASILAGVKPIPVEQNKFKENKIKQTTTNLTNEISSANASGENIPDLDDIERALKFIYSQKAASDTGYNDITKLKEILKFSGSNKAINTLIDIKSQPYNDLMAKIKNMSVAEIAVELKKMGIEPTLDDINKILQQMANEG